MGIDEEELRRLRVLMESYHPLPGLYARLRFVREELESLGPAIDDVRVVPGGRASDVDSCFAKMFLPSSMIRTQLRLARHYIQAADAGDNPTLSSFVVLRVAIECIATAHWLIAGTSHRVRVERFLRRMWWDTQSTVDMAVTADTIPDLTAVHELEETIREIAEPIKGLDPNKVISSKRAALSGIVQEASRAVRPDYPTLMHAFWMACAGVSHGNITMSAGVGIAAGSVQSPSNHPIEMSTYVSFVEITVNDLRTVVDLFRTYSVEPHSNPRLRG